METIAERLKYAIAISGKKKIQISRETGIDKGSISNYVNGRYEPKSGAIYKLAATLNVSEAWLLGYDVPMKRDTPPLLPKQEEVEYAITTLTPGEKALLDAVSDLPDEILYKAIEYIEFLKQQNS